MWKRDQSVAPPDEPLNRPPDQTSPDRSGPSESLVMNLGDSVFIKGELSGSEDLTLCGHMEGSVKLQGHTLTIGPHARIDAEITAKAVVVMGAVVGNVNASERVAIEDTGSVTGDIVSPVLAVADGGFFKGRMDMSRERPKRVDKKA